MTSMSVRFRACLACLLWVSGAAHAGDQAATLSMLDGPAWVIHAASRWSPQEGATIATEDIVETAPATTLLRLEFEDGTLVDLGPSSRLLITPKWPDGGPAVAYLLQGWAKVSVSKPSSARHRALLATPALDVTHVDRDVVIRVQGRDAEVFAESGDAAVMMRGKGAANTLVKIPRGQFLARRADAAPQITARPAPDFIQSVPRPFMDTLPARAAVFQGKKVAMTPTHALSYADVEAWVNAEPRVRARFPVRWKSLAQDAAFRRKLSEQLPQHPEWAPVLNPEPRARKAPVTP